MVDVDVHIITTYTPQTQTPTTPYIIHHHPHQPHNHNHNHPTTIIGRPRRRGLRRAAEPPHGGAAGPHRVGRRGREPGADAHPGACFLRTFVLCLCWCCVGSYTPATLFQHQKPTTPPNLHLIKTDRRHRLPLRTTTTNHINSNIIHPYKTDRRHRLPHRGPPPRPALGPGRAPPAAALGRPGVRI